MRGRDEGEGAADTTASEPAPVPGMVFEQHTIEVSPPLLLPPLTPPTPAEQPSSLPPLMPPLEPGPPRRGQLGGPGVEHAQELASSESGAAGSTAQQPPGTEVERPAQPPSFGQLLQQLEAEHSREVAELRDEIARLRMLAQGSQPQALPITCVAPPRASPQLAAELPGSTPQLDHSKAQLDDSISQTLLPVLPVPTSPPSPARVASEAPKATASRVSKDSDLSEQLSSPLCVVIESARGLRNADWGFRDMSDPYCVCEVPGKHGHTYRTSVCYDTLDPVWNHKFVILEHTISDPLCFTVFDKDRKSDELLGSVSLTGSQVRPYGFDGEVPLHDPLAKNGTQAYLKLRVKTPHAVRGSVLGTWPSAVWLKNPDTLHSHSLRQEAFDPSDMRLERERTYRDPWSAKGTCLLHPGSMTHLRWELLGLLMLVCNLVWVPLQVFAPPESTATNIFAWMDLVYWTSDILITCNSGHYLKDGKVEMKRLRIILHYARTWLLIDLTLVSFDWFMAFRGASDPNPFEAERGSSVAGSGKVVRVTRIVRLFRLMRLAKLRKMLFSIQGLIDSEWVTVSFTVVRNLLSLLAINHLLACAWFFLGTSAGDAVGWVNVYGMQDEHFYLQYLVSMHWSLAQFTPGSTPIQPTTMRERVFAAFVLALGLVVATCFMSSITSTMASVWTMNHNNNTNAVLLKKFLHQNGVSRELGSRITRYVDFVLQLRHSRVHPSKVQFLSLLSGPLHIELQAELYGPQLALHPCFQQVFQMSEPTMREICTTVVASHSFAKNDTLFLQGSEAKQMFFLTSGSVAYRWRPPAANRARVACVEAGHWFLEAVLWLPWRHKGTMKALTEVDVVSVNAAKFGDVVTSNRSVYTLVRTYAFSFWQELEEFSAAVTDVPQSVLRKSKVKAPVDSEVREAENVEAQLIEWDD